MSERGRHHRRVPRGRRVAQRVAALTCLLGAGAALYLVADGVGFSTDDINGGGDDDERATLHEIATFGAGKDEDIAVGEGGRVGVVFRRPTPTGTQTLARLGQVKGGFGPLRRLSRTSSSTPRIDINEDGVAAATWVAVDPSGLKRLQVTIAPPGGQFGAARTLDRTIGWVRLNAISVRDDGDVTVTWRRDGRSRVAQRVDGQFEPTRDTTNESAIAVDVPDLDGDEADLVAEVRRRPTTARIVEVVAAGDHVVCAVRQTAAQRHHLQIVSIY